VLGMNPIANQLRHRLRFSVAAALLLILPFVAIVPRAAAMDDHAMHTQQSDAALDCATACARAMNTSPTTTVIKEDETRTPDPEPREVVPYYQQFQTMPVPKKLRPAALYDTLPGRPPDIVKLSGHFLF
jgi:hypothetical protein